MTLTELADRVEGLTGLCRETDGDIANALSLYPKGWRRGAPAASATAIWFDDHNTGRHWSAPAFSASLDAAMTLVPEGFVWTVSKLGTGKYRASIAHRDDDDGFPVEKPTIEAAAALTSASLRARASMEGNRG